MFSSFMTRTCRRSFEQRGSREDRDEEGRVDWRQGDSYNRQELLPRLRCVAQAFSRHEHHVILFQSQIAAEISICEETGQVGGEDLRSVKIAADDSDFIQEGGLVIVFGLRHG